MDEIASENSTATEKLIAFESRYKGRLAGEHEKKLHDARVYENYDKMADSTKKTFEGFGGRWIGFCEEECYHMLDTTAKPGQAFLEQERLRHENPGNTVKIAFTQFKQLCEIRGCPVFRTGEFFSMHREVSEAGKDSAQAALHCPVDEDRNIITSAELQEPLRVCADMPELLEQKLSYWSTY